MKKFIIFILTISAGLIILPKAILARTFPQPQGHVNDFAQILSQETIDLLEADLTAFEVSSSNELTVAILSSLEGDVIENTAVELFDQWNIGKKNQNNGVLLLIVPDERELRIEVGYGLEPILTDRKTGNIIRTVITPEFKQDDYDAGVIKGVEAIEKVLTEDPQAFDIVSSATTDSKQESFIGVLFFLGITLFIYITAFLSRSKRFWPGGVIGALTGLFFGLSFSILLAIVAAILLALFGLFLDFVFSKNYKFRKSKGLSTSWWKSGGGFSSGRSSGGGFGGFGGGSSGGGGASGSW